MSSSSDSFDSVVNIDSSNVTCTASRSAGDLSNSDHSVDRKSDGPSYEWVNPRVLDIPTCFRSPNDLDKILSKVSFLNRILPQTL